MVLSKHEVVGKMDWKGNAATKDEQGGMRIALLVLGSFALESMATLSIAGNGVSYLKEEMHFTLADSANHLTNFVGTAYILSILMAFLADTFLGRFKTLLISSCIELMGLAFLSVQAHYPKLGPPVCNIYDENAGCIQVRGGDAVLFFVGLYLIAIGTAGVKAALPSHGADQFDENDPKEAHQIPTYFNFFLLARCFGAAISYSAFVWVQNNKGWDWGFGLSALATFLAILLLLSGLPRYRLHVFHGNNAVTEIIQVYVTAFRNRKLQLPEDSAELYEVRRDEEATVEADVLPHTADFRFLDKAAIQVPATEAEKENSWKLCSVTQVENAKILLRMVPIFCCNIISNLCLAQLQTFSVQQGSTMDTSITKYFHIPPASLSMIPFASLIILIPIYDRIFVPFIRRHTGNPNGITYLQRIGVGLVLSTLSMATAALIEEKRKNVARQHNMLDEIPLLEPLPITVFWLSFQYFIYGIADMFTFIGLLEFFYSQAPKNLKAVSSCFLWSSVALGYFLSTIIVKIVNSATKDITRSGGWLAGNNINRNHLNLFYWLLAALNMFNFFIYLFIAMTYKYRPQNSVLKGNKLKQSEAADLQGSA